MSWSDHSWMRDPVLSGWVLRLFAALLVLFVVAAATIWGLYLFPERANFILSIQVVLLVLCIAILLALVRRFYRELIQPISSIRSWASRMREGDYSAEITLPAKGQFADLLQDISQMGRWYKEVGFEGDEKISEQLRQMARKTRLLEILYDIAASISVARDLNEVLERFLHISAEITHARAALVRLVSADGDMRLVASVGESSDQYEESIPMIDTIPDRGSKIKSVYVISPGASRDFRRFSEYAADFECVIVSLIHQGDVMGAYQLLMDQSVSSMSYDLHELLTSIGFHLGLAVHKAQLDEEAQRQSIFRERLTLAHELHDSLAQSMASLRFQCKALEASVGESDMDSAAQEIVRLREGVDRANGELRELLAHFRAPIDQRGLVPVLSDMLKIFREENQVLVFSQFHCDEFEPPTHIQRQVIRIVQEALANVRKHADARMVRLLLRLSDKGACQLLLEDDGRGFEANADGCTADGKHIGLRVMRERAAYIDAELNVESEAGEGTRVELSFRWDTK